MIDYYEPKIDLTLLGCGFLGSYHIGAICLLKQIWPHKPYNRLCGASCGGLIGTLVEAGIEPSAALDHSFDVVRSLRSYLKEPARFRSIKSLVEQKLEELLDEQAHARCSGKVGLSLTRCWSMENVFVSQFESRRELIDAVQAGCFIPLWSGRLALPTFRGEKHIDGAYSNNTPKFQLTDAERADGLRQVHVSPFSGEIEVSPKHEPHWRMIHVMGTNYCLNWRNILRSNHAMLPFSLARYKEYLKAGHRDMKDYVLRSNLIKCRHCYEATTTHNKHQTPGARSPAAAPIAGRAAPAAAGAAQACRPRPTSAGQPRAPPKKSCLECLRLMEKVDSLQLSSEITAVLDN